MKNVSLPKGVYTALSLLVIFSATGIVQAAPRHSPKPIRPAHHKAPAAKRFRHLPRGARRFVVGGVAYWVHAGIYYMLAGDEYVVVTAPVIKVLPRDHRMVVLNRKVYYVAGDVYYKAVPSGYVVVERPVEVVTVKAKPATTDITTPAKLVSAQLTLHVPKQGGSGFKPVVLKKLSGGYLGPQGEFYPVMPTIAQLSQIYGVDESLRLTRTNVLFIHVPEQVGDSFVPVELKRHNGGYLGPQGEFYPIMPTVAHLTEMYGGAKELPQNSGEISIQVSKKDGLGKVEVILKRHGTGYLGPQGEFYPELPDASHLAELYGN